MDRTIRKKMKTPRRKRVENSEDAHEIMNMVEERRGERLSFLLELNSRQFLLLLNVSPSQIGTDHSSSRIRQ
jgi:hypothetical protein